MRPAERSAAAAALDAAWREHWGRLLAMLLTRFRRVDLAEDALAEAYARAADRWVLDGVPANPAAWLLTTARHRVVDVLRAEAVADRRAGLLVVRDEPDVGPPPGSDGADGPDGGEGLVPDDRLRLVLLCCHPALDEAARAALALRLVLGVPTEEIARLFLVSHPTMSARLTRAKRKIVRAGVPFALPPPPQLPQRLAGAARTTYLCFTAGYAPGSGADLLRVDLAGEAVRLGRVLDELAPGQPALRALLALMLLQHSRRDARTEAGRLVVLSEQDRRRWHQAEIAEALALLDDVPVTTGYAEELRLQALIAAEHATAPEARATDWARIDALYTELDRRTGSPVVRMNRAVAAAEARGPAAGLALLDGLDHVLPHSHRLPAVRADLLARLGDLVAAEHAYAMAIDRCDNDVEREHLERRRAGLAVRPE